MRRLIRAALALAVVGAAIVATGCTSIGAQPANPLVPANTARDTVNKANDSVNGLQNQVDQSTTP